MSNPLIPIPPEERAAIMAQNGLTEADTVNRGSSSTTTAPAGITLQGINANDLIKQAIAAGRLSSEDAHSIIYQAGFQGQTGEGRVQNAFNNNPMMNSKAMELLKSRGITPPQTVQDQMSQNVLNPQLPNGGELVPTLQSVQQNELLDPNAYNLNPTANQVGQQPGIKAPTIQATNATAAQVNPNDPLRGITGPAQYDAYTVMGQTPQMQAAMGSVNNLATVQGQLAKLYADFGEGVPPWAQGAVTQANEIMAARGLGASSIGASAVAQAMQNSALNIAAQDAATYFQMDLANLNNQQQANLANTQFRQQSLLSDQAAINASRNFNASSAAQLEQFQATLIAQIQSQNADRTTTISAQNALEANKIASQNAGNTIAVDTFNTQQRTQIEQYNSQLANQREQFNAQMRYAIDQSNVTWRRGINTANTASINAANQVNVQNAYNMSQIALNNVWQAWRDEAAWAFTASENQKNRDFNLVNAANNRNFTNSLIDNQQDFDLYQQLGGFVLNKLWT